jgi:hypothetical protein
VARPAPEAPADAAGPAAAKGVPDGSAAPAGERTAGQGTAPRPSPLGTLNDLLGDAVSGLRERHPDVVAHLTAAGGELVAAYRAVVGESERRWTSGESGAGRTGKRPEPPAPGEAGGSGTDPDDSGPGDGGGEPPAGGFSPTEHIDLD